MYVKNDTKKIKNQESVGLRDEKRIRSNAICHIRIIKVCVRALFGNKRVIHCKIGLCSGETVKGMVSPYRYHVHS